MKSLNNFFNWISPLFGRSNSPKVKIKSSVGGRTKELDSNDQIQQMTDKAVVDSDSIENYKPREKGVIHFVNSKAARTKQNQDAIAKQAENEHEKACFDLNEYKQEIPEQKDRLMESFDEAVKNNIQRRRLKLNSVQKKRKQKQERAAEIKHDTYELAQHLPEGKHSEKNYNSQGSLLIIGIVLLSFGEFSAVLNSLKLLGASVLVELPLAFSIVLALFVLAKALVFTGKKAELIIDTPEKSENIYDYFFCLLILVSLVFTIALGHMRIDYLQCVRDQNLGWMTKGFLYMLNPILFACGVALVVISSNRAGDIKKLYSRLVKMGRKIKRQIERLERKEKRIKQNHLATYHRNKQNYLSYLNGVEFEKTKELEDEVLKRASILNDIHAFTEQELTHDFESARSAIQMARADIEAKTGEKGQWGEIVFSINDECYEHPFKQHKQSQKQNKMKQTITKQLNGVLNTLMILFSVFILGSCSSDTLEGFDGEDNAIIHIIDETAFTQGGQYKVKPSDIWAMAEMHTAKNGLEYTVTKISDVSLSEAHTIDLDPSNDLTDNELEREDEVETFSEGLAVLIEKAYRMDSSKTYSQTELFTPLREVFEKAYTYPIDTKVTVILQSDLLHNRSDLSMYSNKLSDSRLEKLYEKVNSIMPDMVNKKRSIHLIVLYKPNTANDDQFRFMYDLLKEYLTKNGVTLSLKANL